MEGETMSSFQAETDRVRAIFDASAAQYDKSMAFNERLLFGDGRAWACSEAQGQVLVIAIGTGLNLPFYPANIELTGIEISPAMLEVARRRAKKTSSPIIPGFTLRRKRKHYHIERQDK